MIHYNGSLSDQDKKDIQEDACATYQAGSISLLEFTQRLATVGLNATDIAELEKFYRPPAPENDGD